METIHGVGGWINREEVLLETMAGSEVQKALLMCKVANSPHKERTLD
jgi:hypothetical protein